MITGENSIESRYPLTDELSGAIRDALETRRDGILPVSQGGTLHYEVLGEGDECLVLANGLGGRLYTWLPLIEQLAPTMKIITWDYRGLFDSDQASTSSLSVSQHAEDLAEILKAEKITCVHLCGWSMGVQVSLEFSARYPSKVLSLCLINGTYGQVFSTAFQPWLRVPAPTWMLHEIIEGLRAFEGATKLGLRLVKVPVEALWWFRSRAARLPMLTLAARQYCQDLHEQRRVAGK